ncbi:putative 1,3-beta-glucan synthase [Helianthus anomalus]
MEHPRRGSDQPPVGRPMRIRTTGNLDAKTMMDSEVVLSSLFDIAPVLRVANEVYRSHPRVAYLSSLFDIAPVIRYGFILFITFIYMMFFCCVVWLIRCSQPFVVVLISMRVITYSR